MLSTAGLFAFLRRAFTRPRFTVPLVTLVFALVGVVGLGPVIQVHDLSGSLVASELEKLLEAELKASKRSGSLSREIGPTWLTTGSVEVFAKWDENQKHVTEVEKKSRGPQVRADRLALLIASWLLAVLLLALGPSMASPSVGPSQQHQTVRLLAEAILEKEADLARTHAQALYSRLTALLLGGVLIAFLGVVVFYLALPEDSQNPVRAQKLLLAQTVLLGDSNFPIDLLSAPYKVDVPVKKNLSCDGEGWRNCG